MVVGLAGVGHAFMAVNIAAFDEVTALRARVDGYIGGIPLSPRWSMNCWPLRLTASGRPGYSPGRRS